MRVGIRKGAMGDECIGCGQELTKDDHTRRPVPALLILCPAQLDHVLRSRMRDVYFS